MVSSSETPELPVNDVMFHGLILNSLYDAPLLVIVIVLDICFNEYNRDYQNSLRVRLIQIVFSRSSAISLQAPQRGYQ